MCKECNTPTPSYEDLEIMVTDTAYALGNLRARLFPVLSFVITQTEIEEIGTGYMKSSRDFTASMLVSVRDTYNSVCEIQEALRGVK